MPIASSTCASTKWPMRAFAITGMVTASMMPRTMSGSDMRATPPSLHVRRHALQRHHGAGAGLLRDAGVFRRDHVHDHAALEHLGEALLQDPGPLRFHHRL